MGIQQRIDSITKIGPEYLRSDPPAPKSVKIEVSPRCQYRCGFCALRTRQNQPTKDMDFGLFQRITTEMRAAGVEEIGVFYLGESTMAPELLAAAIRHCKDAGFPYVFLTTNGSLCEPEVLRAIFAAGLDSLKFSCNAADERQFQEVVGVTSRYWKRALVNIRSARRIRDEVGSKCTISASSIRYDGEQQARMEAFLAENVLPFIDPGAHYWLPLYSMGAIATAREAELGFKPTAGNQGRLGALRDPLPCWSAFTEGHVRADGGLSLCCFDSDGRFVVGDLTRQPFMEAWNSEAFQRVRAAHLAKDVTGTVCEACVAY